MKVYSRIYLVKDKFGNKASASCEESFDTIQIGGLTKENGEPSYFESDAYHLASHCVKDGLEMKVVENIQDFDELWNE